MATQLLIDGYNLLHVTGLVGRGRAAGTLQHSREALLRFLGASLDADQLTRTTIVFDAAEAPPGLPRVVDSHGMTVRYAAGYPDADTLIEELIEADHVPRSLLVVSSDRRIQRAARRRRAGIVNSDVWYAEVHRNRQAGGASASDAPVKPTGKPSAAEVEYWVKKFGGDTQREEPEGDDPFPPGYAEKL